MEKTEMMKRYEETTYLDDDPQALIQIIEYLKDCIQEYKTKAEAYNRLIEKLSLWGKHLKSASMAQNSFDFIYCAQQVMDEITLTLPDGWEEACSKN